MNNSQFLILAGFLLVIGSLLISLIRNIKNSKDFCKYDDEKTDEYLEYRERALQALGTLREEKSRNDLQYHIAQVYTERCPSNWKEANWGSELREAYRFLIGYRPNLTEDQLHDEMTRVGRWRAGI